MAYTIKLRRGPAAEWVLDNPVLEAGEAGYEVDTNQLKIGDGVQAWNDLSYLTGGGAQGPPGDSAYEVAVANGFVGTEVQWLASLQGTDGVDGTNGVDGTDGVDGASVTVTLVPAANWPPAADSNPLHLYFRVP